MERLGDEDLAGLDAGDVRREPRAVGFGDAKLAGRNIEPGETVGELGIARRPAARDRHQEVVPPRLQKRVLGERAGRH